MPSTSGISLMVLGLLILVVPGALYNNLNNNGLVVSQTQALSCSADPQTPTCQISGNVGCQSNSAFCTLSGSTISFLSPCSPFTNLITGNLLGFISSFFSTCGKIVQQNPNTYANTNIATFTGNETIPGLTPVFGKHSIDITSGQAQWTTSTNLFPVRNGYTLPVVLTCLGWQVNGGYTNRYGVPSGHELQNVTDGCVLIDSTPSPNQVALNTDCWLFGNTTDISNAICTNFAPGNNVFSDTGGSAYAGFNPGNIVGFALGLLGAGLLIIMALGIDVSAFTVSLGENRQSTKFAQVFGMGFLIWGPLYSEFNPWFSTGLLPYGFDGLAGIVGILVILLFWFGLYRQATSD